MSGLVLFLFILFFALATMAGLFYLGWFAYRLYKAGRRLTDRFQQTADALAPDLAALQQKQDTLAGNQVRLTESVASLQSSLERLSVVTGLIGEALGPVGRLRALFRR